MKKVENYILKILGNVMPINSKKIIFVDNTPNSGSNVKKVYEEMKKSDLNYEFTYVDKSFGQGGLKDKLLKLKEIATSKYVITSHTYPRKKKNQIFIEMWHGIPLKKMGLMEGKGKIMKADYYISSSETYSTLLNSCIGADAQYNITGFPRNDYLLEDNEGIQKLLEKNFNINKNNKIYLFMPTFRNGFNRKESSIDRESNIFAFENTSMDDINNFLKENNIHLLVKMHPIEEKLYLDNMTSQSHISFITQDFLKNNNIDIYQVLAYIDTLITDYSSVYFDYLLLDRPLIFLDGDMEEYSKNRGFLLEPVNFWRPGEIVINYSDFRCAVNSIEAKEDKFKSQRNQIKSIMHRYTEPVFTKNTIEYIKAILKDNE